MRSWNSDAKGEKCRKGERLSAARPASVGRSEAERECREKAARVLPAAIFSRKEKGRFGRPLLKIELLGSSFGGF